MIIPCTDTPKPLYKPIGPSDLKVFAKQLPKPENSRSAGPLPTSAANLNITILFCLTHHAYINLIIKITYITTNVYQNIPIMNKLSGLYKL